ncbi:IclR family transcriptional regulator [Geodermatophilus sp. SYSU D01176]
MTRDRYGRSSQPTTVEAALDILESVARFGAGVTAKEIAAHLHMPPATCYRLLNSLVASEYLVRVDDLHGFSLGRRTDGLVTAASVPFVPTAAKDVIADLREGVRFGVHLMLYLGDTLHVGDADPDRPLRAAVDLQRHLHASAAGKLLLAHLPRWREALPRLTALTCATITDPERLEAELQEIRRTGVARQVGESHEDVACLAVPVCSRAGVVVGAVCLAGPVGRAGALDARVDEITVTARRLSSLVA